ncbi:uncharacterized protein A4U43_C09F1200 [Asparagus officinalis]|uniref:Late embryogenesis abundant protein LEA-2 subgroup domain-containing protein n=1 Tax=Asparagus officinalis TaxID=4686 RepID=A0A5P1E979_ASPOF|nr:uncharacterized protein A4U43_C09F1200 [Asparagus officinalis]
MSSTVTGYPGSAVVTGYPASAVARPPYSSKPYSQLSERRSLRTRLHIRLFASLHQLLVLGFFSAASSPSETLTGGGASTTPTSRPPLSTHRLRRPSAVLDTHAFVIAHASAFPFSQRGRDVTDLRVRLGAVGFYAADGDRIRSGDGEVRFWVRVSSTVRFKLMEAWKTGPHALRVYCDDIRVRLKNSTVAGAGSMAGPARGCRVFYDN